MKNLTQAWALVCACAALGASGCGKAGVASVTSPHTNGGLVATQVFGPSVVSAGTFTREEVHQPWSSWWFPNNDDFLFADRGTRLSPLSRYDEYAKRTRGVDPGSAAFEESRYNPSLTDAGDGLCNAWSAAAILEPEPTKPRTVSGVAFDVVDLKALLIKSYELLEGKRIFGHPYRDEGFDDRQDLYPEQFHRLLEVQIMDKGEPFVMDTDSSSEVWNTPVSAAILELKKDPGDPGVMHVLARLLETLPSKDDQDLGFIGQRGFWAEYSYDLVGNPTADGRLEVVYGTWTDVMDGPIPVKSVRFHPDFVSLLPKEKKLGSRNSRIDPEIVREILGN
jgi:hypothetical protein